SKGLAAWSRSMRLPRIGRKCSPTRSSGSSTQSTPSTAASFPRRRTTCIAATRAATRRSVERITSAMSEALRLPFYAEPETVRLKGETVRLKADTTYEGVGDDDVGSVRLQPDLPDANARRHAVDPSRNVVLEASAGTGKTRVLVERYVNLIRAGVEPDHLLA